jgi:hypothetical protein
MIYITGRFSIFLQPCIYRNEIKNAIHRSGPTVSLLYHEGASCVEDMVKSMRQTCPLKSKKQAREIQGLPANIFPHTIKSVRNDWTLFLRRTYLQMLCWVHPRTPRIVMEAIPENEKFQSTAYQSCLNIVSETICESLFSGKHTIYYISPHDNEICLSVTLPTVSGNSPHLSSTCYF